MKIKVKYFGMIAEAVKETEEYVNIDEEINLNEFSERICSIHPQLQGFVYSLAVNQSQPEENIKLKEDDEVALLPPFAGG